MICTTKSRNLIDANKQGSVKRQITQKMTVTFGAIAASPADGGEYIKWNAR